MPRRGRTFCYHLRLQRRTEADIVLKKRKLICSSRPEEDALDVLKQSKYPMVDGVLNAWEPKSMLNAFVVL